MAVCIMLKGERNNMKISYVIYIVEDHRGNKDYGVVNEPSDTIQICGMRNKDDKSLYFESEAYHLETFCEENGLTLRKIDREGTI